jgi:hypothetical protein
MTHLRNLLSLSLALGFAFSTAGCGDDCDTYCRNQGNFIDECLPQFDQTWSDLADGDWAKKSDFIGVCGDQIEDFILSDIEIACEDASEDDRSDCENTIRQGTIQICGEHLNDFTLSCTDYWSSTTDFTPTPFTPTPPTGDDDDSAGDDDDSAGDDDDSGPAGNANNNATVQYQINYWAEYSASTQVLNCRQVVEADAEIVYGVGAVGTTCNNCTGLLTVDPSTAVDVSNPAADPEHCDPAVLAAEGADYGIGLMLTKANGGFYGDFQTMGLVDDSVHETLGIDWSQNPDNDQTASGIEDYFADPYGLDYVATGLVQDNEGTLANDSGLTGVAVPAGAGSNWYGYWRLFRNPKENPWESTSDNGYTLSGVYGLDAMWVITFGG